MSQDLKPCPFCGASAPIALGRPAEHAHAAYFYCANCGASGPEVMPRSSPEAAEADAKLSWNSRAQAPAAEPQWQPIETLPDDQLAILYGAKRSEMVIGMRHSRDGWVIDTPSEWASMYPPKLWMPLPAAPSNPQPANTKP